jgi:outer membrane protein OmpA-like peptidoglycan-associated protein
MSFNIIESVKEGLSDDMTNKIAGILGESSTNVHQALHGIIPSIFTGALLKIESGDPQEILNLATEASRLEIPYNLNSLSGGTGSSRGMDFLKFIFGEKSTSLTASVSSYSGISDPSASALLSLVTPVALCTLGKHILNTNMNASGLRSFLNGQKKKILNALPSSIFIVGILGTESLSGISEKFSGTEIPVQHSGKKSIWIGLLVACLIVVAVAGWYYFNKQSASVKATPIVSDNVHSVKDTVAASPVAEPPFILKLPDGTVLNAKKGSLEDQLVIFFNDPESKPSRRYPFTFDQLAFNGDTKTIASESMMQLQNVALILKAYPRVKIKIGGFNEKGGDSAANRSLSEGRAIAVAKALKEAGAGAGQIISVEGFGSDFAKYPSDAPDSLKDKDHRTSISVRAK